MAQLDVHSVNTLIGDIYNAALEPEFWQSFLCKLQQVFQARSVAMCHSNHCFGSNHLDLRNSKDFDPAFAASYNSHYKKKNILLKEAFSRGLVKPGALLPSRGVLPFEVMDQSEFFNEWVRPQGIEYYWTSVITLDHCSLGMLTLTRDSAKGDLTDEELSVLRMLVPHLQRAFEQHQRIGSITQKSQALLESLDQIPTAVVLIDAQGNVIEANRKALEVHKQDDGLTIAKGGKLAASGDSDSRKLSKCLALAVETSQGDNTEPGGIIQVERPSGKHPYKVVVSPMQLPTQLTNVGTAHAVVFIMDPESKMATSQQCLCKLFELTPAESRLAQLLAAGKSLDDAAADLEVSKNTLKTLLQRIYSKTNTNRQGELISLLLRCNLALNDSCPLDELRESSEK